MSQISLRLTELLCAVHLWYLWTARERRSDAVLLEETKRDSLVRAGCLAEFPRKEARAFRWRDLSSALPAGT